MAPSEFEKILQEKACGFEGEVPHNMLEHIKNNSSTNAKGYYNATKLVQKFISNLNNVLNVKVGVVISTIGIVVYFLVNSFATNKLEENINPVVLMQELPDSLRTEDDMGDYSKNQLKFKMFAAIGAHNWLKEGTECYKNSSDLSNDYFINENSKEVAFEGGYAYDAVDDSNCVFLSGAKNEHGISLYDNAIVVEKINHKNQLENNVVSNSMDSQPKGIQVNSVFSIDVNKLGLYGNINHPLIKHCKSLINCRQRNNKRLSTNSKLSVILESQFLFSKQHFSINDSVGSFEVIKGYEYKFKVGMGYSFNRKLTLTLKGGYSYIDLITTKKYPYYQTLTISPGVAYNVFSRGVWSANTYGFVGGAFVFNSDLHQRKMYANIGVGCNGYLQISSNAKIKIGLGFDYKKLDDGLRFLGRGVDVGVLINL